MGNNTLVRYMLIPLVIGFAGFASIVLTSPNGDLTTVRLLVAAAVMILSPAAIDVVQFQVDKRREAQRAADRDKTHREATAAAFKADVERITGRPFPTGE